ncbi:hypothetical protein C1645_825814 [Glomus cerebriforme]|uniref:WW domain-containing protein n=1 Tax=Glomus cerebriforme TaxID=658196 RepID=A0A397SXR5_9GLOM|nr:hypothetical protein C1645_825814 [Glomus cerebriforme]
MDPRPLPPGFISQYDQNTQRYFYVDTRTGVSQWNHPLDVYSPPVGQTSSQSIQFPSPSPNPNPQGHYPLGFTDPSSIPSDQRPPSSTLPQPSNYPPTTYGGGGQMPQSDYGTSPYAMQQQYPQPTPSNYPSSYPQSGSYGGSGNLDYRAGYSPHGEAQSYVGVPPHIQGPSGSKESEKGDKSMGGIGGMGKMLLGTGMGAAGGLLVGNLAKKKFGKKHHHHHHKGWKGKWKGWKGKGWKGKGWKGKGWK